MDKDYFKKCIESYEAIKTLYHNGLVDNEEAAVHEHNLLYRIISEMKMEIEE